MRSVEDELMVYYHQTEVGMLWRDTVGKIGFKYGNEWVSRGFAISQQLPLTTAEYTPESAIAHIFFANLLPEAAARERITRDLKIVNSDFELLKAIGGECAGALSIMYPGNDVLTDRAYIAVAADDFNLLLQRKGRVIALTKDGSKPRLSLAGAQDKCPILVRNGEYLLPRSVAPTTHILKFEVGEYKHVPAYEYFLCYLARSIGLKTVNCELKRKGKNYYLLIERFDRIYVDGELTRLHQEDFCQALGYPYEKKYQQDGGPDFAACLQLVRKISADPTHDVRQLLQWQLFNVLAGNSDGHAKNLSILYHHDGRVCLAPFYDLVCTRAIEDIDTKLAMAIGEQFEPGKIIGRDWRHFAMACEIKFKYLSQLLKETALALQEKFAGVLQQFEHEHGSYPALQRVQFLINSQCKKTLEMISKC